MKPCIDTSVDTYFQGLKILRQMAICFNYKNQICLSFVMMSQTDAKMDII